MGTLTIAATSGVNFTPLEFEVLEQTHVVQVTRAAAECHYSCEQRKVNENVIQKYAHSNKVGLKYPRGEGGG